MHGAVHCHTRWPWLCVDAIYKLMIMNELIQKIVEKTGISQEKANEVLATISGYVSQKFPHLSAPLQSVWGGPGDSDGLGGSNNDLIGGIGGKFGI